MPYPFAVECICDKLAATRIYAGKNYSPDMPLKHWSVYGVKEKGNPRIMRFIDEVFQDVRDYGEDYVLNSTYMKKKYHEVVEK